MLLCCMKTVKDVFTYYKQSLASLYDVNHIESIALLAVNEITSFSNATIKAFPERDLSVQQSETLRDILNQLKTGKPIQYILGKTEFYGLTFKVNSSVLIPRPETEELVAWVIESVGSFQLAVGSGLKVESEKQKAEGKILDIGTGSGCIAISLKKNLPGFNVLAIDISKDALKTAKENAKLNDVNVEFIEADILNVPRPFNFHLSPLTSSSIIISNPPYVTQHDKTQMHINVTDFEPHTALFVPENDPLIFYKAIADFALTNLIENGLLFFEINESLGADMVELLKDKGFRNIELRKDMSGRDRMIRAVV